jgi:hypothetical protein
MSCLNALKSMMKSFQGIYVTPKIYKFIKGNFDWGEKGVMVYFLGKGNNNLKKKIADN